MSASYENQFTRVEITGSRYAGGQLLVSGKGMAGEAFTDLVWYEPHGFHSRPHKGAIGYLMAPGGRRDQGMVMAASEPGKVPEIGEGEAAMYDNGSNVVRLTASGWAFNMDVTITGNLTVSGDIELSGDLTAGGSITDADGDGGA